MSRYITESEKDRLDFEIISDWIKPNKWVLDLGCGDGSLLAYLTDLKKINGVGVELNLDKIIGCMNKGIPVVQQNLNQGISNFRDNSFDYCILSMTLQVMRYPDVLVKDMLRVAKHGIISFPNFGNISLGLRLMTQGRMPKSPFLPFEWYDTPNIHMLTIQDFRDFCKQNGIKILDENHIYRRRYSRNRFWANMLSESCVALITRE